MGRAVADGTGPVAVAGSDSADCAAGEGAGHGDGASHAVAGDDRCAVGAAAEAERPVVGAGRGIAGGGRGGGPIEGTRKPFPQGCRRRH